MERRSSSSLVTHTRRAFFREVLELWDRLLEPGAFLFFTYLGKRYLDKWIAGELGYGHVSEDTMRTAIEDFRRDGHAFCGTKTTYSQADDYGIAFATDRVVTAEISRLSSLRLLELLPEAPSFGQDLAVVRKAGRRDRLLSWRRVDRSQSWGRRQVAVATR